MTKPREKLSNEAVHDRRTALVRDMVAKESAALDARTAKLRALRLEKEAAEEAAAPATPVKKPKKR